MSDSTIIHSNNPIIAMFLSVGFLLLGYFGKALKLISFIEDSTFQHLQYLAVICSILASMYVIVPKIKSHFKKDDK